MDLTSLFQSGLGTIAESAYRIYHYGEPVVPFKDLSEKEKIRWRSVVRVAVSEAMVLHKNAVRYFEHGGTSAKGRGKEGDEDAPDRATRRLKGPEPPHEDSDEGTQWR